MDNLRQELESCGYRVLDDGSAVIVISANGKQDRETFNLTASKTVARRYDSIQAAFRRLVKQPGTAEVRG